MVMLRKAVSFGHGGFETIILRTVVPMSVAPGVYVVTACVLSPKVPVPFVCHSTFPLTATPFNCTGVLAHVVSLTVVALAEGCALIVTEIAFGVAHPKEFTSITCTVPPP